MGICAYGQLLPPTLLDAFAWVNLHPSALPSWRGAAPVERAILAGDTSTATAVMAVVHELDAGPVAAVVPFEIGLRDNAGDVMERSLELGVPPLAAALADAAAGTLETTPQATDGRRLRAQADGGRPPARPGRPGRRRRPARARAGPAHRRRDSCSAASGSWSGAPRLAAEAVASGDVSATAGRLLVGFVDGTLEIETIQPGGKRSMSAGELLRGRRGPLGPATRAG